MNKNNRTNNQMLGVFNILFFIFILVVLAVSVIIVFKASLDNSELSSSVRTLTTDDNPEKVFAKVQDTDPDLDEFDSGIVSSEPQFQDYHPTEYFEYLSNPGIGWINHFGEENLQSIPTTLSYSDRSEIRWSVLNPEEGVYNWEPLDAQLNQVIKNGKQFSFRVYTMAGESFGGHAVPNWVLQKGAVILQSGEPDYSNCVYQQEWGNFVNELVKRYDGNSNIAFIDISGYGNFNEWSWRDDQTLWDEQWEEQYQKGIAGPATMSNIDSQARRRLADMFIGGNYFGHACRDDEFHTQLVDYDYLGFQQTQLVMPYAGIIQSSQYVYLRNKAVGFRHDCLGRPSSEKIISNFGEELNQIWIKAPVVFETCSESQFKLNSAVFLINAAHGSIIHNANLEEIDQSEIMLLANNIGYRYFLKQIKHSIFAESGGEFFFFMNWQNLGNSPNYPKMGQTFSLFLFLLNVVDGNIYKYQIADDLTVWLPSNELQQNSGYQIERTINLPTEMEAGTYQILVSIINLNTGLPIQLAIDTEPINGLYPLSTIEVKNP